MQNPYNKPAARIESVATFDNDGIDPDAATFQPAIFTTDGRIGRLRFLAYSTAMELVAVLFVIVAAIVAARFAKEQDPLFVANVFGIAVYVGFTAITLIAVKRRLNDLDHTGWLSLLCLVPLLNIPFFLYVVLWPGTAGHNNYGPRPVPNSLGVVLTAVVPVMCMIVIGVAVWSYLQMNPGLLSALTVKP